MAKAKVMNTEIANIELVNFLKEKGFLEDNNKNIQKIKLVAKVDMPIKIKVAYETTGIYTEGN